MSDWNFKERGVGVSIDSIMETTLKNRMSSVYESMTKQMNIGLYGDREPFTPWSDRPLSYRLKWYFDLYTGRVRDAWLVLIGKEQIGGDY